ncbi:DHHC palmitoyltransferase-domain-containing protein [Naematelia encephala]|uniref:Palmitoyltransferase n=1 Tax=Naematelia encephala TaxID=71784 RepID=A0A1Y2AGQ0_9TREE|nr:DHHC palmitoyltransferase-domain-containing protein [Naematelia encephala]
MGSLAAQWPPSDARRTGNAEMIDFLNTAPPPSSVSVDPQTELDKSDSRCGAFRTIAIQYAPGQPDPWIQRKLAVFICFGLGVWSFYVVVGRVCTPMIQRRSSTGYSRGIGAGTLVIFVVLWLMFGWSYLKMIMTGPGFAKQHVPSTITPSLFSPPSVDLVPYSTFTQNPGDGVQPSHRHDIGSDALGPDPSEFAPVRNVVADLLQRTISNQPSSSATLPVRSQAEGKKRADWRTIERPVPQIEVGPRWCRFCKINKPDRTHHCRHCGTCILQFDHHCLWIGQCVGWANHKFFIIFNFWAMTFTLFLLIFLCVVTANASTVDGQVIGLLAVSALFALFTSMMLFTHIHLILTGRSTVESFKGRDQHEQESAILQREFGLIGHYSDKRKVLARWKEEWGGSQVDARWRFGSKVAMWRQEMGLSWAGWIFPIGRPLGDGLHFDSNPRFGPNGEWLKRKDWPKGVV